MTTTLSTLQSAVDDLHRAGIPGVCAEVHDGDQMWRGAAGVADLDTGRPFTPDLRHRVGSVTKTFTAAAVLRQVEQGRVELDAPIGRYLPHLVPGERGDRITVRMLLNHTSGIAEYIPYAFPSLRDRSFESLDANRFRRFDPAELVELGLRAPATGEPGSATGVYSNTNYVLLGQLLERVTGTTAEDQITRDVIDRAGLAHTAFPTAPRLEEPHSRLYEGLFGQPEPREYSVYDMSWVWPTACLVSTVADLNLFYRRLLAGTVVHPSSLAQMRRTVPVIALDGQTIQYGLGLHRVDVPGSGTFWGHDGTVWGAMTISMTRADGRRQLSVALNLARWHELDASGKPKHHPIDDAVSALRRLAMGGDHGGH